MLFNHTERPSEILVGDGEFTLAFTCMNPCGINQRINHLKPLRSKARKAYAFR
jgi:hypothetical protein